MKAMTKKLLSMLVVLAMVLSMVPVVGLPAITAKAVNAGVTTADGLDFSGNTLPTNCPCGATANWEPLLEGTKNVTVGANTTRHYYLEKDMTLNDLFLHVQYSTSQLCLHLNGHTLTTNGRIYSDAGQSKINLMGSTGTVNYTGTGTFVETYGHINVYGGTYNATNGGNLMHLRVASWAKQVYGSSTFNGPVIIENTSSSTFGINDSATFTDLTVKGGACALIYAGWTGTIHKLQSDSRALINNKETLWSSGAFTGKIFDAEGSRLIKGDDETAVVDNGYNKDKINTIGEETWGFCEACSTTVKWTAMTTALGTAVDNGAHYYLPAALDTGTKNPMTTASNGWNSDKVCLNLNGQTLTTAQGFYLGNGVTLNVIANGGSIAYNGAPTNSYPMIFRTYSANLNLYGGTYTSTVDTVVYSSGNSGYANRFYDAQINGTVEITGDSKQYVNGTTNISEFKQSTATGYVEFGAGWSGTITKATFTALKTDATPNYVPAKNAVLVDGASSEGRIYLENGNRLAYDTTNGYLYEVVPAVQEEVFNQEDLATFGQAWCEHCRKFIAANEWQVLEDGFGAASAAISGHYYVANSFTNTKANNFLQSTNDYPTKACIQLNGNTITTSVPFEMGGGGEAYVNIMDVGDGGITYTGTGQLFLGYSGNTRLYGGTYTTDAGVLAVKSAGSGGIFLRGDTTLVNGGVNMTSTGKLYFETSGTIPSVTIGTSSQVKIYESFTGRVDSITFAAGVGEDKLIPETSATIEGDLKGSITMFDGRALEKEGTQLKANDYFDFAPESHNGYSWCPVCEDYYTWTAINGTGRIGYISGGVTSKLHYYLSAGGIQSGAQFMEASSTEAAMQAKNNTICLNLNGMQKTIGGRFNVGPYTTLNVMDIAGDATVTFDVGQNTGDYYRALFDSLANNAVVNLYGGTFEDANTADNYPILKVSTHANAAANIKDKGVIITGAVQVDKGVFTLAKDAKITNINVAKDGKLVVNGDFTGTATATFAAEPDNDGLIPEANGYGNAFQGTLTYAPTGKPITATAEHRLKVERAPKDAIDFENYDEAWCEACRKYIAKSDWVAVHAPLGTTAENGKHYYIADDFKDDGTTKLVTTDGSTTYKSGTICLHLNEQEIQTAQGIYVASNSTINIVGSGKITYNGTGNMIASHSGTIYLYGGTYVAKEGKVLYPQGGYHTYMYNDAKLEGLALLNFGTLHLYDEARVDAVETHATNVSLLKLEDDWTGSVGKVTIGAALTEGDGVLLIPTNKAQVVGTLQGILTLDDGATITQVDNTAQLQATKIAFNPTATWNNRAYCPVCKTTATWTECTEAVGTVSAATNHLYLTGPVTYASNYFLTAAADKVVHFNMNGNNITATDPAAYGIQVNGTLDLFNTNPTQGGVYTGSSTSYGAVLINNTAASFTLHKGVTLKTMGGQTTINEVVLYINYGTAVMLGGTVDARNTNARAVLVGGREGKTAYFTMEGGNIYGGNNSAVQVGNAVTDAKAEFVMNGGTITGGTAANGGSIYATSYCKKLELLGGTIQDGNATSNGGNVYIAAGCATPVINGVTIQGGEAVNGGNLWLGVDTTITKAIITGGEATTKGGNIYALGVDLTIEENATIQNGTVGVENKTTGFGGGNIFFGQGTLTTSGTITGGKAHAPKGAGGNIFLDNGQDVGTRFIMNGGKISGGQLLGTDPEAEPGKEQAYGANIRAYRVESMKFNAGTIFGGIGGADNKAHGRDVFISTASDLVTDVTIGTGFKLTGAYYQGSNSTLKIVGAPQIDGAGISYSVPMDISQMSTDARVNLVDAVAGEAFATGATNTPDANGKEQKDCFHVANAEVMYQDSCLWIVAAKVGETCYATTDAAVAAANGKVVVMAVDGTVNIPAKTTATVDANGHNITVSGSGTLQAMDSSNKDFDGCGVWTILGVEKEPVTRNDGDIYVLILNEDSATYSAHYLDIRISAVNLRTSSAGLYYTAEYKCDATLAANIRSYGVGLSIYGMPENELDAYSSYTAIQTKNGLADKLEDNTIKIYSGAVTNIFTNDAENSAKNAENAAIEIYANAYLEIDTVDSENTYVFGIIGNEDGPEDTGKYGDGAVFTMGKVLQAINTIVAADLEGQTAKLIANFCQKWTKTFTAVKEKGYDVQNIINLATNA